MIIFIICYTVIIEVIYMQLQMYSCQKRAVKVIATAHRPLYRTVLALAVCCYPAPETARETPECWFLTMCHWPVAAVAPVYITCPGKHMGRGQLEGKKNQVGASLFCCLMY